MAAERSSWVLRLADQGGDDLAVRLDQPVIRRRAVGLHQLVQLAQGMIGHHGEHVVFDVVAHVPVKIPIDGVQVDRAGVQAVIQHILCQTGMLLSNRRPPCSQAP